MLGRYGYRGETLSRVRARKKYDKEYGRTVNFGMTIKKSTVHASKIIKIVLPSIPFL